MSPTIRLFTRQDISRALQFCRSAGWNQLHSDWSRLIEYQPDGCFIAEIDDHLVGTVTTTSYGTKLAWIGMMLVHPDYRRRGIATALMKASLAYLRDSGVQSIKLDATPEGQPVYERLGFQAEWSFHRWQLELPTRGLNPDQSHDLCLDSHKQLDLRAFGVDRLDWLSRLRSDSVCNGQAGGFGMIRAGQLATYLGPVTAADFDSAEKIIGELLSRAGGTIFWDLPQPNRQAVDLATRLKFTPVRNLMRMFVGDPFVPDVDLQYAICDPGTG